MREMLKKILRSEINHMRFEDIHGKDDKERAVIFYSIGH